MHTYIFHVEYKGPNGDRLFATMINADSLQAAKDDLFSTYEADRVKICFQDRIA